MRAFVASQDPAFRQQACELLLNGGHQVVSTDQSSELLERALSETFDLFVVDLAGRDGLEAMVALRRSCPDARIVAVSEKASDGVSRSISREEICCHFYKPIDDEGFLKIVIAVEKERTDAGLA